MSWRAVLLGLIGGLLISAWTFYNDMVLYQTRLIGSALPISVFGAIVLWVAVVNPLLGRLRRELMLRPGEIGVAAAVALAACSFPGQGFFQYFTPAVGTPAYTSLTRSSWTSAYVMSYLPGGSAQIGLGHVADWNALLARMRDEHESSGTPAERFWRLADDMHRAGWRQAWSQTSSLTAMQQLALLASLNAALADRSFLPEGDDGLDEHQRVAQGRAWLVEQWPEAIRPPPRGRAGVLNGGLYNDEIVGKLQIGLHSGRHLPWTEVPWRAWFDPTWVWLGGTLMLSLAAIALALIVHPQWAQREMLAFPIPQFVQTLSERGRGDWLPEVMRSRLFWAGLVCIVALHLVNGLHAWFPIMPQISQRIDGMQLAALFPNMRQVPFSGSVFAPVIYPSVAAFAFFVARSVSLSLGITPLLFMFAGGVLISRGIPVPYDRYSPNGMNFLRFGAYLAMIVMIIYSGRHYYLQALRGGLGLSAAPTVTPAIRWAARALVVLAAAGGALYWAAGLSPLMAGVLVVFVMGTWLVLARITGETGMFLLAGPFVPLGILPGLMGIEALGPTQLLLLGIIGFILLGDAKESLMIFVVNGLEMGRRMDPQRTCGGRRLVLPMACMVVIGAMVALVVSISLHYEHGTGAGTYWGAAMAGAARSFDHTVRAISDMTAMGSLSESVGFGDLDRVLHADPDGHLLLWAGIGAALLLATAIARLRLSWWPLHPVIFLVIGTWGISMFWASFLLGWVVKTAVVGVAGGRGYILCRPLMVGVIAGELIGGLGWMTTGALYTFFTGLPPTSYTIFPI